jgi:hypothetical protein
MSGAPALEAEPGSEHPLTVLRDLVRSARLDAGASERCAMCAAPIASDHRHLIDLGERTILCMCTPCELLFADPAAAGGRYRQVPSRYAALRGLHIGEAEWDALQIPVSLAFFFRTRDQGRIVAFYPGPAGATESLLPLDAWATIAARHPQVEQIDDDVEAVLVRRAGDTVEGYVVPIDRCYELTGRLRMHWSGFDGGIEARRELDAFFDDVRERSGG